MQRAFNAAAPSDFFQLLNLDLGASTADIKQSYRALQRLVHPDLIGEPAKHSLVLGHVLIEGSCTASRLSACWVNVLPLL